MVKSKLPPQRDSNLEAVEPHPEKGAIKFFLKKSNQNKESKNIQNDNHTNKHTKPFSLKATYAPSFVSSSGLKVPGIFVII